MTNGEQLVAPVDRAGGRINVVLAGNVTGHRAAALAEAARAAIRAHDPRSATIGVSVVPAAAAEQSPG
ncbi:MAG: hypothetical protein HKN44_10410 [Ilumatobacter sp.]|nr:hypothetical protein [Ilumatobacter sp.]